MTTESIATVIKSDQDVQELAYLTIEFTEALFDKLQALSGEQRTSYLEKATTIFGTAKSSAEMENALAQFNISSPSRFMQRYESSLNAIKMKYPALSGMNRYELENILGTAISQKAMELPHKVYKCTTGGQFAKALACVGTAVGATMACSPFFLGALACGLVAGATCVAAFVGDDLNNCD